MLVRQQQNLARGRATQLAARIDRRHLAARKGRERLFAGFVHHTRPHRIRHVASPDPSFTPEPVRENPSRS